MQDTITLRVTCKKLASWPGCDYCDEDVNMQDTTSLRLAFDMLGFNGNDNDNAHCDIR